jgi:hypothetical protein
MQPCLALTDYHNLLGFHRVPQGQERADSIFVKFVEQLRACSCQMGALKQDFRTRCANFGFTHSGGQHDVSPEIVSYSNLNH